MFWLLVILLISLIIYYILIKPQYYWRDRHVKQGPPIPLLGDSYQLIFKTKSNLEIIKDFYNRFPDVRYWGLNETLMRTLIIRDPNLIKQITVKDFEHFTDHRTIASENDLIWNKNLFALKGNTWRDMRATLSPTFTSSKMKSMFTLMEKSAQQYVAYYLEQNKDCIDLDLKDSLTRFANDVIANCAFGITVDSLKQPKNSFYLNGVALKMSGVWLMIKFLITMLTPKISKFFNLSFIPPEAAKFFTDLVKETVKLREEQNIIRPDMMNLMLEARKGNLNHEESNESLDDGYATVEESHIGRKEMKTQMTDTDMAAQVMIFFFAGFDTISTTMSFLCYELAVHPDIQERLRQEIDWTYRKCKGELTYTVLANMKYLDMVISENLRKNPPFVSIDRVCTKPYTIQAVGPDEKPVLINVGQGVYIPIIGIHHDAQYYPKPLKFDPERFSDENKENIQPYTFLPFGTGPRNCVGSRFALMEIKTLIFHVLSKFELIVIEKTTIPMKYDKVDINPSLEGGFWVGLKRRDDPVIL